MLNEAQKLERCGAYAEALARLEGSPPPPAEFVQYWLLSGRCREALGQKGEAIAAFQSALSRQPENAAEWNARALAACELMADGLASEGDALAAFAEATRLEPANRRFWNNKANFLELAAYYSDALAAYEKVLELSGAEGRPAPLADKGACLNCLGRFAEALLAYEEATRLDANYAEAWHGLGNALYNLGQYADALAAYEKAALLSPKSAVVRRSLGSALEKLDRLPEAYAAYGMAAKLDPKYYDAWSGMGTALRKLGHEDAGRRLYGKGLEIALGLENKEDENA